MTAAHYARRSGALTRRCPDRTVVLVGGQVHDLLGPSAVIWELLAQPSSMPELLTALRARYASVPASSVDEAVQRMETAGLIEACPSQ